MGARIVMPLRMLLPCLAVCLVASGAAAIGVAGVSAADGYLMRQADDALRACATSMLSHGLVAVPGPGPAPGRAMPGGCGMELRSAGGQMLIPPAPAAPGPAIPASSSQRMLYAYGPDDLRYVISGPAGTGSSGMLIVMTPLAGTGQVAAGCAAAAGIVLVLLAAAAFALTRAILRPLGEAAGLAGKAGQGAGDRLEEVLARLSVLANRDHGRCGMTLARMRERLHASCAAEAAARRSAADLSGQLGQTCLQLRRPVSILHGFTEYCRRQDRPPPAGLDRMLQRVTDEITQMETLAEGLHMCSASESTRPDRRPDPPATDPAAYAPAGHRKPPASADHVT